MEIVGKLTAKTLGWDRATLQQSTLHVTTPILMATVVGIVSGLKPNVDEDTGDVSYGLKGNYRGISTRAPMIDTGTKDANGAPVFAPLMRDKIGEDGKPVMVAKLDDKDKPVKDDKGEPVMVAEQEAALIEVRSGVCYLPSGLQDMIEGAYAQAIENDPKATVSFGLDLYCLKDTNKAGYTFKAETKVEAQERDPLELLMSQAKTVKALPAPGEPAAE